ncbi:MAG: hypothetical protein KatS3mg060_2220 [Dehalococcoidia bacterium]|nr:MAG: hypothetical protein KatS3mg060_2220 [Dehalococcoidia bacterium]
MAEQSERTGRSSGAGGRAPRAEGWRTRAEQAHGGLVPDPSLTLTASEIGAYTFCPQAWYLQRCRVPVTAMAEERRRSGSATHREIGRQTDLVRAAGALRTILLFAIGVLLVLLVALVLRGLG